MNKLATACVTLTVVTLSSGCIPTDNRIVDKLGLHRGSYFGELGLTGDENEVIIDSRSRLTKLSIIGDKNNITVEHGATLGKVEIWGTFNSVSVPEYLLVRVNNVGEGNVVERRPAPRRSRPAPATEILTPEEAIDSRVMPPQAPDPVAEPQPEPIPLEIEATDLPD